MLTLLFYEPNHSGHHYPYLARMLPGFSHPEVKIVLATTAEGAESPHYERFLKPLEAHFTLAADCAEQASTPFRIACDRVSEIARLQQQYQADHVILAYGDGIWQIHALRSLFPKIRPRPRFQTECILYRGEFSYPSSRSRSAKIKRFLFRRLLAKGIYQRILIDDELLFTFAQSSAPNPRTHIELAINPIELFDIDRAEARRRLGMSAEGKVICLSGVIDKRNGLIAFKIFNGISYACSTERNLNGF